jgi:hypothetical protein
MNNNGMNAPVAVMRNTEVPLVEAPVPAPVEAELPVVKKKKAMKAPVAVIAKKARSPPVEVEAPVLDSTAPELATESPEPAAEDPATSEPAPVESDPPAPKSSKKKNGMKAPVSATRKAAAPTPVAADLPAAKKSNGMSAPMSGTRKALAPPVEAPSPVPVEAALPAVESEEEEDEEIRLAMEMAMAAAQNPKLSALDIRKLVGEKNKQTAIVDQYQREKEHKALKEKEEAQQRWQEKKDNAVHWWKGKTDNLYSQAEELKVAAAQKAEELKDLAERRIYAEEIKNDRQVIELKKKIKVLHKTLKAHRLQGNREDTRHVFKRQRQEKKLIQTVEKLDKTRRNMTSTNMNVGEYAKGMMKASKRWKKMGTDEELMLEAQLCRNMHQMLTIEKQSSMVKKSTREMKKYLQRCKGWLSDKKAFCEMNNMTLDATTNLIKSMYEETLFRQDALIARLLDAEEFKDLDIAGVASEVHLKLDGEHGSAKTLNALKGLYFNDSIRIKKKDRQQQPPPVPMPDPTGAPRPLVANFPIDNIEKVVASVPAKKAAPIDTGLYVETTDDVSVSSNLSDPDDDGEEIGDFTKAGDLAEETTETRDFTKAGDLAEETTETRDFTKAGDLAEETTETRDFTKAGDLAEETGDIRKAGDQTTETGDITKTGDLSESDSETDLGSTAPWTASASSGLDVVTEEGFKPPSLLVEADIIDESEPDTAPDSSVGKAQNEESEVSVGINEVSESDCVDNVDIDEDDDDGADQEGSYDDDHDDDESDAIEQDGEDEDEDDESGSFDEEP